MSSAETTTPVEIIRSGSAVLGIEFGSTRIKSVLIAPDHTILASGSHEWENELKNGIWTYDTSAILHGLQSSYASLKADVQQKYGCKLTCIAAMGISAMMHGYLAFDSSMQLLVPFRTWRNTITAEAAAKLTSLFAFNMPQRWSLTHLYQAMLNKEPHVASLAYLTTLAGWIHYLLTGQKVLGIGDASGMMPIDEATLDFDAGMKAAFNHLVQEAGYSWTLEDILPKVLPAGANAGSLTKEGAALLDPEGDLAPGCPLCPPEGDAGTGMTATNSVRKRTGNVSAGTSIFSMVVLERPLSKVYPEIDVVTTPSGQPVGMVHCNSCTSDINAWVNLFGEVLTLMGAEAKPAALFPALFNKALEGAPDCGGLVNFNYYAGEPVTGVAEGRPMLLRLPDAAFNLSNFMRTQIYASMETLKYGMDLMAQENVAIDCIYGHGGLFKTPGVAQSLLAAAIHAPVTVMETAGEGGAWGMALLADYMLRGGASTLADYLDEKVFAGMPRSALAPTEADMAGFDKYMQRFTACIPAQNAAAEGLKA